MDIELYKKIKKEKKLTMNDIAERAGISKRTIEDIFAGRARYPRIDTVQAIEKALGISSEPQSNEITEERLQALGFDLTAISNLSEEDLQLIRSTLKTLVTELKERKKK